MEAKSASAAVTDALRKTILRGVYASGERLRQDEIAAQFRVSQTIVREAFKDLVSESLLIAEPRRGVHVPPLAVDDAKEMTVLRSIIEPQALQWSIPYMTRDTFDSAAIILNAIDVERNIDCLIDLNNKFHMNLYSAFIMPRTVAIITNLRTSLERYLRFVWENTPHLHKSQAQHRELVSLCESTKITEACALLKDHILKTGDVIISSLECPMGRQE